jgi:hypothetical protein
MNTARQRLAGGRSDEITSSQADVGCLLALMQRGMGGRLKLWGNVIAPQENNRAADTTKPRSPYSAR